MAKTGAFVDQDTRLIRTDDEGRGTPGAADDAARGDPGGALTEKEVRDQLRAEWMQESLPNPPKKTGWHRCWLSTTSPYDSVDKRMRLGYRLVRKADEPNFRIQEGNFSKSASNNEMVDFIMCNEMVLAEIPEERYQLMMREFHDVMPREEEERVTELARKAAEAAGNNAKQEGDGLAQFEQGRRPLAPFQ
jgi:hypothetical protein